MTLLTVKQAAAAIHRRPQYVREMIRDGRVTAYRLVDRGPWLVDSESLYRLLGIKRESDNGKQRRLREADAAEMWRWR
jgi:hypothetical protein